MRNKISKIWSSSKETLIELVKSHSTLSGILRSLNVSTSSANYATLKVRLKQESINIDHIKLGLSSNLGRKFNKAAKSLEEILVENSCYNRTLLKKRLIEGKFLRNFCYKCGLEPKWNNEYLSLQLDHINGNSIDNRLQNLQLLCPNCHSQTATFSGKRFNKNKKKISENDPKWRSRPKFNLRKVVRPSKEDLNKLIYEMPKIKIAEQFGVSDTTISKWIKSYCLVSPPRGFWLKKVIGNSIMAVRHPPKM